MVDLSQLEKVKTVADVEAENARTAAIQYLNDTDWYIIRLIETQAAVSGEITANRADARKKIKDASK
jgi:hypothetical protein